MSALSIPQVGEVLHGFEVKRIKKVDHLDVTAIHMTHQKTQADYLHLARDDPNNAFTVAFKTLSLNARGVPHVLEHSTLCGSEKYPVHDPFLRMLSRSLYTYMNALTYMDYTAYPVASPVPKGFKNLVDLYLDSIFFPLLRESDFGKESWRLAPTDEARNNPDESIPILDRLQIKGVVYNEMKGHLGSAATAFYNGWKTTLFPKNHLSGGDPLEIPQMTHDELTKFHKDHYHPSNARILTYGNRPLEENLLQIAEVLNRFDYKPFDIPNMELLELKGRMAKHLVGPADKLSDNGSADKNAQHKITLTWHAGDAENDHEVFAFDILESLLYGGYGTPLYRALIETGLAKDFSSGSGYSVSAKTATMGVGVSGVKRENLDVVEQKIKQVLAETAEIGFEQEKIDGVLHQAELRNRIKTAQHDRRVNDEIVGPWILGLDPIGGPQLNDLVEEFKSRLANNPAYLTDLIRKYLLSEDVLVLTMEPSETFQDEWNDKEKESIAATFEKFSRDYPSKEEAYQAVVKIDAQMDKEKDSFKHEDLSSLPTLDIDELPREPPSLREVRKEQINGHEIWYRETATSGITYFRVVNPLEGLTPELRPDMSLFASALRRLDTKDLSVEEIETRKRLVAGAISASYITMTDPTDSQKIEEAFYYSGHALDKNVPASLDLLYNIISKLDFDGENAEKRMLELIKMRAARASDSATYSGHHLALQYAKSKISYPAKVAEEGSGITSMLRIASLAQRESIPDVMENLKAIQKVMLTNFGKIRVHLTAESEAMENNTKAILAFLDKFSPPTPEVCQVLSGTGDSGFQPDIGKDYIVFPAPSSFAATATATVPAVHKDAAKLQLLSQFLTTKHLLHEIRVVGSAYGGGAFAQRGNGLYCTYSYRDPTPLASLSTFAKTAEWMKNHEMTDEELKEAKISIFTSLDRPISVMEEGLEGFTDGFPPELVKAHRKQCLDATIPDLKTAAENYISTPEKVSVCILGSKENLPEDLTGWRVTYLKADEEKQDKEDAPAGDV